MITTGAAKPFQKEAEFARETALLAGAILIGAAPGSVEYKVGTDIVTKTDFESEAVILQALRAAFPLDTILAEESGRNEVESGRRWCVDPLDGTVNFANGIPYFCVSIGLEDPYGGAASAVYDPVRQELFSASRGATATLNGVPISAAPAVALSDAVVVVQLPEPSWRDNPSLTGLVHSARGLRLTGSTALDLAWTAAGRYDLCIYRRTAERWDWVAGEHLIDSVPGNTVISLGPMGDLELMAAGNAQLVHYICDQLAI